MSETVPLPRAVQSLSPKDVVQRRAVCPRCNKWSSEFIGPGQMGTRTTWTFRCSALTTKGAKADHLFAALPDRNAPKTIEETVVWVNEQKMSRLAKPTKSQS